jgi:hypothetical protein
VKQLLDEYSQQFAQQFLASMAPLERLTPA